jgi:hypothetical protein
MAMTTSSSIRVKAAGSFFRAGRMVGRADFTRGF